MRDEECRLGGKRTENQSPYIRPPTVEAPVSKKRKNRQNLWEPVYGLAKKKRESTTEMTEVYANFMLKFMLILCVELQIIRIIEFRLDNMYHMTKKDSHKPIDDSTAKLGDVAKAQAEAIDDSVAMMIAIDDWW